MVGSVAAVGSIASGVSSVAGALGGGAVGGGGQSPQQAQAQAGPFTSSMPTYVNELNQLMAGTYGGTGNAALQTMPGYQAGLQAVERTGAAQGFTGSGNMENSLLQYGGNVYAQQEQILAQLAGANLNPLGAVGLQQAGQQANNQLFGQGLNSLSGAATSLMSGGSPYVPGADSANYGTPGALGSGTYGDSTFSNSIGSPAYSVGAGGTYNFGG